MRWHFSEPFNSRVLHPHIRVQHLAAALIAHDPDVIVLGEYHTGKTSALVDQLRFFGWSHVVASAVPEHVNGVGIVSRLPLEPRPSPLGGEPFARWAVEAQVGGVGIVAVYAPLPDTLGSPRHQRGFWQALHTLAQTRATEPLLVIGDYNTCAAGADGPNALACSTDFERLPTLGWVDAWRAANPNESDFSYVHRAASGVSQWRIDHAFVSPVLAGVVRTCRYSHIEREAGLSDHSMLLMEVDSPQVTT